VKELNRLFLYHGSCHRKVWRESRVTGFSSGCSQVLPVFLCVVKKKQYRKMVGETSSSSTGAGSDLPTCIYHRSMRDPREDGGPGRPLCMDRQFYPCELSVEAPHWISTMASPFRGRLLRDLGLFSTYLAGRFNSFCLWAFILLHTKHPNDITVWCSLVIFTVVELKFTYYS